MAQMKSRSCRTCHHKTLHVKSQLSFFALVTHAALTLVTFGIWFPIGVIHFVAANRYHCQQCGRKN